MPRSFQYAAMHTVVVKTIFNYMWRVKTRRSRSCGPWSAHSSILWPKLTAAIHFTLDSNSLLWPLARMSFPILELCLKSWTKSDGNVTASSNIFSEWVKAATLYRRNTILLALKMANPKVIKQGLQATFLLKKPCEPEPPGKQLPSGKVQGAARMMRSHPQMPMKMIDCQYTLIQPIQRGTYSLQWQIFRSRPNSSDACSSPQNQSPLYYHPFSPLITKA
ncbi:hypothetical protein VP01_1728g1 [Puccinia sorghi]|uniref:Uncharacterized protein n=1 Tax=Puccinia sorghi TaxID=27349 RepID=A0A0L6VFY8_9BASI|nr:hypothetical protein VP01_1728g1 [Puccinia sorghi]